MNFVCLDLSLEYRLTETLSINMEKVGVVEVEILLLLWMRRPTNTLKS